MNMWLLPISMLLSTALLAVPLSRYLAWIMNGEYKAPGFLKWFEDRLDTGNQNWKQYTVALLVFNALLFTYSYVVMAIQPWMPLNELHRGMLAPTTMAHAAMSLSTNTDLQHWSGDVHFSNFSQIFVMIANFFFSASIGFCALAAIIRALRFGPDKVGSFFLDMWRVMIYMFLPVGFVLSLICLQQGMPMTFKSANVVSTLEPAAMGTTDSGQAKQQTIVVGPLAAFIPMKQLGTNGGGFFGANSAHPFENPTGLTNFLESVAMMLFPMALVLMYGRMLHKLKHAWIIFSVMMGLMIGTVVWSVYFDTYKPNPGITAHPARTTFRDRQCQWEETCGAAGGRRTPGRSTSGKSRKQRAAFRDRSRRDVCRNDGGRHLRRRQLRPRQPQPDGRSLAYGRNVGELHLWR